uniref:Uncharacterized protein n=1 Tax=Cucumis melo TaxID=3656 RepID=A0A9I9DCZ8_CUCME
MPCSSSVPLSVAQSIHAPLLDVYNDAISIDDFDLVPMDDIPYLNALSVYPSFPEVPNSAFVSSSSWVPPSDDGFVSGALAARVGDCVGSGRM